MIELIFVIVIIGILAAVAIPKLAATRDDAKISAEIASVRQGIDNLGAEFTAKGTFTTANIAAANAATKCFTITNTNVTDGNITVTPVAADTDCPAAVRTEVNTMAVANGILDTAYTAKTYSFGGTTVVR